MMNWELVARILNLPARVFSKLTNLLLSAYLASDNKWLHNFLWQIACKTSWLTVIASRIILKAWLIIAFFRGRKAYRETRTLLNQVKQQIAEVNKVK